MHSVRLSYCIKKKTRNPTLYILCIKLYTTSVTLKMEYLLCRLSTTLSHRAAHNLVLNRPFARTNSYFYSFLPHTISIWNNLEFSLVCAPSLSSFRNKLHCLSYNCSFIHFGLCWNMSSISICCYLHVSLSVLTKLL